MKSVLLHICRDDGREARLQAALDIVKAFDGHLTCLQATPLDIFTSVDPYGVSLLLADTIEQVRALEYEEKQEVEARLRNEAIGWEWHSHAGDAAKLLGDHSWLADLVVVTVPGREWKPRLETVPTAADLVTRCRAPVLAVPEDSRGFDCSAPIAIAWNGSPEAGAALKAALPLLRKASEVFLITIAEEGVHDLPSTDASEYLARHGVASELVEVKAGAAPVSEVLLDTAAARKAACLVAGAYGQSRLRENLLGGVTRGLLQRATIPLLLTH